MSKTRSHLRLAAAFALVLVACAVVASPASAAPPLGTVYCIDGLQSFATWDAGSQHVSDKVVNQFGGQFTAGEVDPANIGRSAFQQYWDALETSDAIGNYGFDNTIPNYIVHTITLGGCPVAPQNAIFLCYSKFQHDPGAWLQDQAEELMGEGYWSPYALTGNVDGGTNVGGFHLECNPPAAETAFASIDVAPELYVGGDGSMIGSVADGLPGYYPFAG
jgi:hypothetical protein